MHKFIASPYVFVGTLGLQVSGWVSMPAAIFFWFVAVLWALHDFVRWKSGDESGDILQWGWLAVPACFLLLIIGVRATAKYHLIHQEQSPRPLFVYNNRDSVIMSFVVKEPNKHELGLERVNYRVCFLNEGIPAYHLTIHLGFAPSGDIREFKKIKTFTGYGVTKGPCLSDFILPAVDFAEYDGIRDYFIKNYYIYFRLEYEDAPENGRLFGNDFLFAHRLGTNILGHARREHMDALEPYINGVFGKRPY